MNKIEITRRRFLSAGAVSTTTLLGLTFGLGYKSVMAAENRIQNIGIELFTVRNLMAQSVPETLAAVARLGYREVEFAGYFGHSPADIRSMVADAGLTTPSSHINLPDIQEPLEQTMDAAAEIGHEYVVLAYLVPEARISLDQYKSYIDLFSRAGEAARNRGLQFGYHNHDFEFVHLDGVKPYDLLLEQVDSNLMKMTLDLYWIHRAGNDPFTYFDKHPGRFAQCHVKDSNSTGAMVDVGSGVIDFASIFAARDQAGFEHYYVEHDNPDDSLKSAENSINFLKRLTF